MLLLAYPISLAIGATTKTSSLATYLIWTNPFFLAFSPYWYHGSTHLTDLTEFLGFCLGSEPYARSGGSDHPAGDGAAVESATQTKPQLLPWLHRLRRMAPRLDWNPVYWRECFRQWPSRWARTIWAVYIIMTVVATGFVSQYPNEQGLVAFASALQVSIGLLLASVAAVTSLSEERVRGSLDVLLATPLKTRSIVWGKWRGGFRIVPWLALLPVINVALVVKPGMSRRGRHPDRKRCRRLSIPK